MDLSDQQDQSLRYCVKLILSRGTLFIRRFVGKYKNGACRLLTSQGSVHKCAYLPSVSHAHLPDAALPVMQFNT